MRKSLIPALALGAIAAPAAAQEAAPEAALDAMAERMADPEQQRQMALMMQTMTEVMLDMPIAPLAQAAAEMAGEKAEAIDPDTTIRKMVPQAGQLSEQMGENLPRAMAAMSVFAKGFAKMAPALEEAGRAMAEQMEDALPKGD